MLIVSIRKNFNPIGVGTSIIMQTSAFIVGPLCYKNLFDSKREKTNCQNKAIFVKENCRKTKNL